MDNDPGSSHLGCSCDGDFNGNFYSGNLPDGRRVLG